MTKINHEKLNRSRKPSQPMELLRDKAVAVHRLHAEFDIPIDRGTIWGNPFVIGLHGDRKAVIEKYRQLLWRRIRDGEIKLEMLAVLHGQRLGCWCAPQKCHGDVLADAAAWAYQKLVDEGRLCA